MKSYGFLLISFVNSESPDRLKKAKISFDCSGGLGGGGGGARKQVQHCLLVFWLPFLANALAGYLIGGHFRDAV